MALDDVGADHRSLALMPFIAPEVIKLDLRLVQDNPSPAIAAIVHAVNAQSERSGAVLLAEGIETEEQLAVAQALGARFGQGWLFGRPGELPLDTRRLARADRSAPGDASRAGLARTTPSPLACARAAVRKALLLAISRHLEAQVAAQGESAVVFAAFQHARHFTPKSAARYETLASSAALVGALGVGLSAEPVPGVRGADLDADDASRRRVERHRDRPALRGGLRRPRPRRHRRPGHGAALRLLPDLRPRPRDRSRARVARTHRPALRVAAVSRTIAVRVKP